MDFNQSRPGLFYVGSPKFGAIATPKRQTISYRLQGEDKLEPQLDMTKFGDEAVPSLPALRPFR